MNIRRCLAFAALGTSLGLVSLGFPAQPAAAAPPQKVTICHATGSATNPYQEITVSQTALAAHASHQAGADVIPAPPTGCAIDLCLNIAGLQLAIPAGLVRNAAGDCVPPDVCPNLPGDQATLPAGYIFDANGNCVPEPVPCNTSTNSGGFGLTVTNHELGAAGPQVFQFDYDTVFQPDHIVMRYEGNIIFDTGGPVGTNGTVTVFVNVPAGTSTQIEVTVDGVEQGTVWSYTVYCPTTA
ncbi:MAG TPA: hypothetical protein VF244_08200 [Acidimicrobiales bacterium]